MSLPVWAVVPASGIGSRMRADRPKQYLPLGGRCILEHSLDRLLSHPRIEGAVVALAEGDRWWPRLDYRSDKPLLLAAGGAERVDSVLSALLRLEQRLTGDALVLVHDAVRPFVARSDLDRLIDAAGADDHGALLATPLADTLKRSPEPVDAPMPRAAETLPRERLWQALTPQAFRLSLLRRALVSVSEQGLPVTDDASAMELAGYSPRLVAGDRRNIKLTLPEDLILGESILRSLGSDDKKPD